MGGAFQESVCVFVQKFLFLVLAGRGNVLWGVFNFDWKVCIEMMSQIYSAL